MPKLKNISLFTILLCAAVMTASAQPSRRLGFEPYTPNRIEWLTLVLQSHLRSNMSPENQFALHILNPDHETILIFVRYLPDVDRPRMNSTIDTARQVIDITAKKYGWDKWVKVREDIRPAESNEADQGNSHSSTRK